MARTNACALIFLHLFACISLGLAFVASSTSTNEDFPHQKNLDLNGSFHLEWKFDKESITFKYTVETRGWAGLGFSPNGGMAGADIVVMAIDQQGKSYISDRHGPQEKNGYPPEDKHQDYILLGLVKNETHITTTFSRKRNTCDAEDMVLTDDTIRVIYAKNDAIPQDKNSFEKHTDRGAKSIRLFNNKVENQDGVPPEPGATALEFSVNKIAVPDDTDTLYHCEIRKFEKPKKKMHVIKIEPLIQAENVNVVHHINIFKCPSNVEIYLGRGQDCFDDQGLSKGDNISIAFGKCMELMVTPWAKGGESVTYPEDLGMPLFETDGDTFLMIEMHYDNPQLLKGKIDSSGIRYWLSEHLRKTETAIATFNAPVGGEFQIVPPGVKEFTTYAYCSKECTSEFPKDGLKVFNGMMHTHLTGRKIRLQHFRNGTQLPLLFADEYYDFNYQDYKRLPQPVTILPGDEFVVECVYQTLDRSKSTFGGYPTHAEMCFIYFEYYPAIYKSYQCQSYIPKHELYRNLTMGVIQDSKDYWTQDRVNEFQNTERNGMHTMSCSKLPTKDTDENSMLQTEQYGYPNFTVPYQPIDECKATTAAADSISWRLVFSIFYSLVFLYFCT